MDLTKFLFFSFLLFAVSNAERKSYHGYKVLRTENLDVDSSKILNNLRSNDFNFWRDPAPGRSADIMASPENLGKLIDFLNQHNIKHSAMIEDVESTIKLSEVTPQVRPPSRVPGSPKYDLTWDEYYSHDVINAFLDELANKYDFVKTVSIGKTHENRDLKVIQILKAGKVGPNVFIDAGIHAREWISPAVTTYMIRELVENYKDNKDIVDKLNFHILPVTNPDGYEYTRAGDGDRLWRKNRFPNPGTECFGIDLNRNFGFHWGEAGTSTDPCDPDIYAGTGPFSEKETAAIKNYTESLNPIPILGHSVHSYSQLWLWPYGFDMTSRPENWEEIKSLAEAASKALQEVNGTIFEPINSAGLYPVGGASDDWYRGVLGTRYAYTTELRDTGDFGFLLPKEQIIPSGKELFAGMKVVFEKCILDTYGPPGKASSLATFGLPLFIALILTAVAL